MVLFGALARFDLAVGLSGRSNCRTAYWVLQLIMLKKVVLANRAASRDVHRSFNTSWFAKAVKKRGISDDELCQALAEIMLGQADDLGGGVWKKRLNKNMDRSIVIAKGGQYWIFVFLFQKSVRENIDDRETSGFRRLASQYARLTEIQLKALLKAQDPCGDLH
jgi:hypothetical protein